MGNLIATGIRCLTKFLFGESQEDKAARIKKSDLMSDKDILMTYLKYTPDEADEAIARMKIQKLEDLKIQVMSQNPQLMGVGQPEKIPITLPPDGLPQIIIDKIPEIKIPTKFNVPLPEINFPPISLGWPDLRLKERQETEIRELAYQKWEEAGRPEGDGKEFWTAAEQEVNQRIRNYWSHFPEGV